MRLEVLILCSPLFKVQAVCDDGGVHIDSMKNENEIHPRASEMAQSKYNDNTKKADLIKTVINKIENYALNVFRRSETITEKENILKETKRKLERIVSQMPGSKIKRKVLNDYISIVMKGIESQMQTKTFDVNKTSVTYIQPQDQELLPKELVKVAPSNMKLATLNLGNYYGDHFEPLNKANEKTKNKFRYDNSIKDKFSNDTNKLNRTNIIKSLFYKIQTYVKSSLQYSKTYKDKESVLNEMRKRLEKTLANIQSRESNFYIAKIMQAMRLLITTNDVKRDDEKVDIFYSNMKNECCDHILERACFNITKINSFVCHSNKSIIFPITKLCNHIVDCPDGSDELNCTDQAINRIQNSVDVITATEEMISRNCLRTRFTETVTFNDIFYKRSYLRRVLENFRSFIEMYAYDVHLIKRIFHKTIVNMTTDKNYNRVNEFIIVLNSVASILDEAICPSKNGKVEHLKDLEKRLGRVVAESIQVSKSCVCRMQHCDDISCNNACERICYHQFTLNRLTDCQTSNGEAGVPLDYMCDGKLDCRNSVDETNCIEDGNKARNYYDHILIKLSQKYSTEEYKPAKNKILQLIRSIRKLQNLTLNRSVPNNDELLELIRDKRQECFNTLTSIYKDLLHSGHSMSELDEAYLFLLSVNENLTTALKYSRTGNSRAVHPGECYCSENRCAIPHCSKACIGACSVESVIFGYFCENDFKNKTPVPLEAICNGKQECSNGADEVGCIREICQEHVLISFRTNLVDDVVRQEGLAVEEAVKLWKSKVIVAVKVVEKLYLRPTPAILRALVDDVLRELMDAYISIATIKNSSNKYSINTFFNLAQNVKNLLKSCNR